MNMLDTYRYRYIDVERSMLFWNKNVNWKRFDIDNGIVISM
jgi:hypothetical protein